MRKKTMKALLLTCLLIIGLTPVVMGSRAGCYGEGFGSTVDTNSIANSAEDFSMDFFYMVYGKMKKESPQRVESFVISPYSVWSVLILAYLGSGSTTAAELERVTRVRNKSEAFYGSRFIKRTLGSYTGSTFASLDKGYFDPTLRVTPCPKIHQFEEIDFGRPGLAAQIINKEVSDTTFGKISKVFNPSDLANSVFVLLNAIYFKGTWRYQFDPQRTENMNFHDQYGRVNIPTQVPMMKTVSIFKYADIKAFGAQVIELPYEGLNISMILVLPHLAHNVGDKFDLVIRRIPFRDYRHDAMNVILNQMELKRVHVNMPKFKLNFKLTSNLRAILGEMGAKEMFGHNANFTLFSDVKPFYVSDVIQIADIEVNEEGTEAAAVTGLIGTRIASNNPLEFIADRPFIFLLRDMTQRVTLFSGVYAGP